MDLGRFFGGPRRLNKVGTKYRILIGPDIRLEYRIFPGKLKIILQKSLPFNQQLLDIRYIERYTAEPQLLLIGSKRAFTYM